MVRLKVNGYTKFFKEPKMIKEDLTDKTIRAGDKVKVARVIADMLGVEKAESMSPDTAVNSGLRAIRTKRMTPELISVLRKMLTLAKDVGIKVDSNLIPKVVKEAAHDEDPPEVDPESDYNMAKGNLRFTDYVKLKAMTSGKSSEVGHTILPNAGTEGRADQIRRMKVRYKTESVDIEEDVASADYKVNPKTGRKYRAHRINFANSGVNDKLDPEEVQEEEYCDACDRVMSQCVCDPVTEAKATYCGRCGTTHVPPSQGGTCPALKEEADDVPDMSDDELDKIADKIEDEDHILDVYDDEELAIVDDETGEEVEDEDSVNEEALNEVLSRMERMRARIRFMRTAPKRARRLKIVLKRRSDIKTLNKRARRLAIKIIKEKLAKRPVSQLSVAEKERVEKMVAQRAGLINRLAMRLVPRVRRIEADRLSHSNTTKPAKKG